MSDIVGWLPNLAADSELKEDAWNRVDKTSQELTAILATFTDPDAKKRQGAYRKQASAIESHLAVFGETVKPLHTHSHDEEADHVH